MGGHCLCNNPETDNYIAAFKVFPIWQSVWLIIFIKLSVRSLYYTIHKHIKHISVNKNQRTQWLWTTQAQHKWKTGYRKLHSCKEKYVDQKSIQLNFLNVFLFISPSVFFTHLWVISVVLTLHWYLYVNYRIPWPQFLIDCQVSCTIIIKI